MEKHCLKCGRDFSEDKKFCDTCGEKLEAMNDETGFGNIEKKTKRRIPSWFIYIYLLLLFVLILFPTKVLSYQVEVPYIDTEQYNVNVPYEDVEEYVVQVPYETKEQYVETVPIQNQEAIRYISDWVKCSSSGLFSTGESTIKITNIDSEGGTFTVNIGYINNSGNFIASTQSQYVSPFVPVTFTYSPTPSSFQQCSSNVIAPIKTTVEYKDVIKDKTVTKYRDETRYKKVTKTRTETREREVRKIRNETRQKEVNWLFGFDAIMKFRNLG
jgi:predicted nucleic acid-binding Zn ribbon protein